MHTYLADSCAHAHAIYRIAMLLYDYNLRCAFADETLRACVEYLELKILRLGMLTNLFSLHTLSAQVVKNSIKATSDLVSARQAQDVGLNNS